MATARRKSFRVITGIKELDRTLTTLRLSSANKAARAGLRAGVTLAAKQIKAEIPAKYKTIRAAIGSRVANSKRGMNLTIAKAGAGVGKAYAASNKKLESRDPERPGVGIAARNIFWFLMGTGGRTQDTTGRYTGAMPAHPAVRRAMGKGMPAVIKAVIDKTKQTLMREAAKARGKSK